MQHDPPSHRGNQPFASVPDGPAWVTRELIDLTIKVWQPFYSVPLSRDDALAIVLNVSQLFQTVARGSES